MHEGIPWAWESFPQFLDFLSKRQFDMDIASQIPHGPLRVYVMGERGANREPARAEDVEKMRELVAGAVRAGAIGVSSSRTLNHRSSKGAPTPSLNAQRDELVGLAMGLRDAGAGVIEMISDFKDLESEFSIFNEMVEVSGRPMSISLAQSDAAPQRWKEILNQIARATAQGRKMRAQIAPRPIGVLLGLTATLKH